jgi:hypothetical protein
MPRNRDASRNYGRTSTQLPLLPLTFRINLQNFADKVRMMALAMQKNIDYSVKQAAELGVRREAFIGNWALPDGVSLPAAPAQTEPQNGQNKQPNAAPSAINHGRDPNTVAANEQASNAADQESVQTMVSIFAASCGRARASPHYCWCG